jgi:hypothetical protein
MGGVTEADVGFPTVIWLICHRSCRGTAHQFIFVYFLISEKLYLKTIHSNTNNTSSIELLNRLSNKHKIVIENMHDDDSGQYIYITSPHD